jgi:hypothetical protein
MGGDRLIRRFRNRLAGFYFLRYMLYCLAFSSFSGGIIVLAVRGLKGQSLQKQSSLLAVFILFSVSLLYSLIRTFRGLPSVDVLRAVFDKVNFCGGLLMTSSEGPIDAWMERISNIQSPRIIWRGRRLGLIFLSAILFLGVSFMVPQRYIAAGTAGRLEIQQQTEQLTQQVEILQEEDIIAEETAQDFRRQIDLVEETASGRDPVKTWEAMGHLQDQLKKAAEEASVGMVAETEELTQVETLAQALHQISSQMDAEAMEGAAAELAQAVQLLLQQNPALQNAFKSQFNDAIEAGRLSDEQLEELMKALQDRKLELVECMGRLCEADLAELKFIRLCESKGQCDAEGLIAMLAACQGAEGGKEAAALYMNNPNWGISRGRGDAPMVWSDPSSKEGTVFKEQVLPPATMAAMKDSELVGVSISAPSVEEGQGYLESGRLSTGQAGSGQAVKRIILPKHKAAVEDYFDRDAEE